MPAESKQGCIHHYRHPIVEDYKIAVETNI